ncbi:MAG: hypothetical protein U9Q03_00315 [Patescibacteria group bacterium]|nr:hypothetical protein [Patescibacteria group bacterium]
MKTFLTVLKIFLMSMGVVFLIVLGIIAYVIIADPFNLRGITQPADLASGVINEIVPDGGTAAAPTISDPNDKNPLLTPDQEAFAESIGIDPATLPTEVTPEMESCLIDAVGAERAAEIKAGAAPSAFEIFKARGCL